MPIVRDAIKRWRENRFCDQVRTLGTEEIVANGFALAADLIEARGRSVPVFGPLTADDVARMADKAEARGELSNELLLEYAAEVGLPRSAIHAIGEGGGILDFFRRIIDWLSDPANREKILAVVKFFLMLLALFGI